MATYSFPRRGLVAWVQAHELVLFFALAFLFSWTIYGVLAMVEVANNTTTSRIELIAAYGPSLSAILLSAAAVPSAGRLSSGKRAILLLAIVFLVVGTEWLDHIWWAHPLDSSVIAADVVLIALAVFVAYWTVTRPVQPPGLSTGITWLRANWLWSMLALGSWPALVAVGNLIAGALGLSQPAAPGLPAVPLLPLVAESFIWFLLFGGPLNEEPGWRGFALPRLCRQFSPLVASVILGTLWGLWHVPLHFMGAYAGGAFGALIRVQEIPRAVLFTWLYHRTKGSLFVVLLFHAAINTTSLFLSRSYVVTLVLCFLLALLVVFTDKMWVKRPEHGIFTASGVERS